MGLGRLLTIMPRASPWLFNAPMARLDLAPRSKFKASPFVEHEQAPDSRPAHATGFELFPQTSCRARLEQTPRLPDSPARR